jgi:hypothetical protein
MSALFIQANSLVVVRAVGMERPSMTKSHHRPSMQQRPLLTEGLTIDWRDAAPLRDSRWLGA